MDLDLHKKNIGSLLPEHDELNENYDYQQSRQAKVQSAVEKTEQKMNAATIARMKLREKQELEKIQRRKEDPSYALTPKQKEKYDLEQERIKENIAELEVIEASPEAQNFLAGGDSDVAPYSGTTKRDVLKLLNSLNINLSLHLTQADTYNLLSCLLTCNDAQLNALYNNS